MKKLTFLSALFLLATLGAHAQPSAGNIRLDVSVAISNVNGSSFSDNTSISLQPTVSYFLTDRLSVGLGVGYAYKRVPDDIRSNAGIIAPQVAYYFDLAPRFCLSLDAGIAFGFGKVKNDASDGYTAYEYNLFGMSIGLAPRLHYYITDKVVLSGTVGALYYDYNRQKAKDSDRKRVTHTFAADWKAFGLSLGFVF